MDKNVKYETSEVHFKRGESQMFLTFLLIL